MKEWVKWVLRVPILILLVSFPIAIFTHNNIALFTYYKIALIVSLVGFGYILVSGIFYLIYVRMKGKIIIEVDNNEYKFKRGGTINGKVSLKLKKPIMASSLTLRLVAYNARLDEKGHVDLFNAPELFSSKIELDGKKEYHDQAYDFSFKIPENAPVNQNSSRITINNIPIFGSTNRKVVWRIEAKLDEPETDFDIIKHYGLEVS